MNSTMHFTHCTSCGAGWSTVEDFVTDPSIELIGCQASLLSPDRSVYIFAHHGHECDDTIEVHAGALKEFAFNLDLSARAAGGPTCNHACFASGDLAPCAVNCYMRWVRDLIPMLQNKSLVVRRAG